MTKARYNKQERRRRNRGAFLTILPRFSSRCASRSGLVYQDLSNFFADPKETTRDGGRGGIGGSFLCKDIPETAPYVDPEDGSGAQGSQRGQGPSRSLSARLIQGWDEGFATVD